MAWLWVLAPRSHLPEEILLSLVMAAMVLVPMPPTLEWPSLVVLWLAEGLAL
jgi:hypothetical protein